MATRNQNIDTLRFVGLLLIILAHTGPAGVVFQLRNFDVPLMAIVAGAAFATSSRAEPYLGYVWKRLKRLLLPTWVFLTLYFFLNWSIGFPTAMPDSDVIWGSYLLQGGIGYVWVIRVFLLIALAAPAIGRLSKNTQSDLHYLLLLALALLTVDLVVVNQNWAQNIFVRDVVLFLLPYGAFFGLGVRSASLTTRQWHGIGLVSALVFFGLCVWHFMKAHKFVPTQDFKYPPQIYYTSFSLVMSAALLSRANEFTKLTTSVFTKPVVDFVSGNSIWIYLWHIPLIVFLQIPSYLKYPAVLFGACTITFFQVLVVKKILLKTTKNDSFRKNVLLILTG